MTREDGPHPGFRTLLVANAKVVAAVAVIAFFAYLIWLGLRALFPEAEWLRPG